MTRFGGFISYRQVGEIMENRGNAVKHSGLNGQSSSTRLRD